MTKVLFLIHDLGPGGAEKVLVNLVNNMNPEKFEVTVLSLFDEGINRTFLAPHVRYQYVFKRMFRGNSQAMKLLSPERLHRWFIKEKYDVEVAFLEGPCARIISGCPHPETKLVSWIHCFPAKPKAMSIGFRSIREAEAAYGRIHQVVGVSQTTAKAFHRVFPRLEKPMVLYNTNETDAILQKSVDAVEPDTFSNETVNLCGVGKLTQNKGFDRMLRIHSRLRHQGYRIHNYFLGEGEEREALEAYVRENGLTDEVTFLGYQTNPYKYVAKCDLYVCASWSEGFSTAATEALIVGTPVCTVEVSGMKEMLGENNEWGIVTENNEEALYQGIKKLLDDPALLAHYKAQAAIRGKSFEKAKTVKAVEDMLLSL